jgi:hypothetical protein
LAELPLLNVQLAIAGDGKLLPGDTVQIRVTLDRQFYAGGPTSVDERRRQYDGRAFTPHFPKTQYESWWLVLGDPRTDDVLALKRINFQQVDNRPSGTGRPSKQRTIGTTLSSILSFEAPDQPGDHPFALFIISDGYLGLDQQLDVSVSVDNA